MILDPNGPVSRAGIVQYLTYNQNGEVGSVSQVNLIPTSITCESAWNKNPGFGVIGIQSGPRGRGSTVASMILGSRGWDADFGNDCEDPSFVFCTGKSIKLICRELRVSRKVVRKVIRSEATEFRYEREAQPLPKIGPWTDQLDELLLANEGKTPS